MWRERYRCAVTLSVDFDAETLWSGTFNLRTPSPMSCIFVDSTCSHSGRLLWEELGEYITHAVHAFQRGTHIGNDFDVFRRVHVLGCGNSPN
jgi:hypothetical protein